MKRNRRRSRLSGILIGLILLLAVFALPVLAALPGTGAPGVPRTDFAGGKMPRTEAGEIKIPELKIPEIDLSRIDAEAEKQKLREALRALDELGISPEKLVERFWQFMDRGENREKINSAAEGIRRKAQELVGGNRDGEAGDPSDAKDVKSGSASSSGGTSAASEEIDRITRQIADEAAEEIGKAAREAASEQIDRAAEGLKDSLP